MTLAVTRSTDLLPKSAFDCSIMMDLPPDFCFLGACAIMESDYPEIGRNIRFHRQRQGIIQKELDELTDKGKGI